MDHHFNVQVAVKTSVEKAVLMKNIEYWIDKNKANNKHNYEGFYWTYNSCEAFSELFPYMSAKKISRLLNELEKDGYIKTGNYNKKGYDRTKWYTLLNSYYSIAQKWEMDSTKTGNGIPENGQPIPNNKPDSKPNKKQYIYTNIFNHWNNQENLKARVINDKVKRKINGLISNYSEEEIIKSITNYATCLNGKDYYWTHKYTFENYLTRGINNFFDDADPLNNFKTGYDNKTVKQTQTTEQDRQAEFDRLAEEHNNVEDFSFGKSDIKLPY